MRYAMLMMVVGMLAAAPVHADERSDALGALSSSDPRMRKDAAERLGDVGTMADMPALVRALRDPDEDTRDAAQQAMWDIWSHSGNAEVDRLFKQGIEQMGIGDVRGGITTFSRIIAMKPEFAEGWNKRATLYFLAGDLRKSLADCDEVIKRNPYHFGALSGYVQIYIRLEYYERALEYSRRALDVNPNLDGIRQRMKALEKLIDERKAKMI